MGSYPVHDCYKSHFLMEAFCRPIIKLIGLLDLTANSKAITRFADGPPDVHSRTMIRRQSPGRVQSRAYRVSISSQLYEMHGLFLSSAFEPATAGLPID